MSRSGRKVPKTLLPRDFEGYPIVGLVAMFLQSKCCQISAAECDVVVFVTEVP